MEITASELWQMFITHISFFNWFFCGVFILNLIVVIPFLSFWGIFRRAFN